MNIVLDTNVLLQVAFTAKPPRIVWDKLIAGEYNLCVTEDILYEYQEKVTDCFHNEQLANALINILLNSKYVKVGSINSHLEFNIDG